MNRKLLALYGLKFNPFAPELPTEALWIAPEVENFLWRIQFALMREGGFALITGESGSGKSVTLRLLSERLAAEPDLVVGAISRPQANVAEYVGRLFHADFHHASREVLTRQGQWVRPQLLAVLDDKSRLCCHAQWYLQEDAESFVHGLQQAFLKRGLPRALMTDNGVGRDGRRDRRSRATPSQGAEGGRCRILLSCLSAADQVPPGAGCGGRAAGAPCSRPGHSP